MTTNKWWLVGAALVIVLVVLAGFTLGISPKLEEVSVARATRTAALAQNEVYELQLAALQREFDSLEAVQDELAVLRAAIPEGAALPAFIGQLDAIADRTAVTLTEFTSADAMPYLPVLPAPDATAPDGAAAGAAVSTTSSPLVTAENFVAVPVTISITGSFDAVMEFLDGVQSGQRLMTVTAFSSSPDAPDRQTGQIAGIVYVLLNSD